jgi:endogenous inhibitor of DNA gyrase (YacG/DUF329 family)
MSDPVNIENMNLIGFQEVPHDAFDVFGLLPQPALIRTYRAWCPVCGARTSTTSLFQRKVVCNTCNNSAALTIQSIFRGFVSRKRLLYTRNIDMMNRWFMCNSINGGDLSRNIMKFL